MGGTRGGGHGTRPRRTSAWRTSPAAASRGNMAPTASVSSRSSGTGPLIQRLQTQRQTYCTKNEQNQSIFDWARQIIKWLNDLLNPSNIFYYPSPFCRPGATILTILRNTPGGAGGPGATIPKEHFKGAGGPAVFFLGGGGGGEDYSCVLTWKRSNQIETTGAPVPGRWQNSTTGGPTSW